MTQRWPEKAEAVLREVYPVHGTAATVLALRSRIAYDTTYERVKSKAYSIGVRFQAAGYAKAEIPPEEPPIAPPSWGFMPMSMTLPQGVRTERWKGV